MRFAFIRSEKAFPVAFMCRHLEVSRGGFYAWLKRPESRRAEKNRLLAVLVRSAHQESRRTYGSPRVHAELVENGHPVGRHLVAKIMREEGIRARRKRRFVRTTDSAHNLPIAPNVLKRKFSASAPNRIWVTDITYIWTRDGWLYLAAVLDLFSRRVVGWAMSDAIDRHLVLSALDMALQNRCPPAGLVHHSDRGSQYASADYRRALKARGIKASMSRKGDCWDNAVAESFFSTLKTELVHLVEFISRAVAKTAVFDYIEVFYNQKRRHSSIGYVSPAAFERRAVIEGLVT